MELLLSLSNVQGLKLSYISVLFLLTTLFGRANCSNVGGIFTCSDVQKQLQNLKKLLTDPVQIEPIWIAVFIVIMTVFVLIKSLIDFLILNRKFDYMKEWENKYITSGEKNEVILEGHYDLLRNYDQASATES